MALIFKVAGGPAQTRTGNLAFGVRCFTVETTGPWAHFNRNDELRQEALQMKNRASPGFPLALRLLEDNVLAERFTELLEFNLSLHFFLVLASPVDFTRLLVLDLYKSLL